MLVDVFSAVYETKFTVEKWQVMVITAGKRRGPWGGGGDLTLEESPSSAGLRPHGPWRTVEIRGPILLETLALYSYVTFVNTEVAKNWTRIVIFFKLN